MISQLWGPSGTEKTHKISLPVKDMSHGVSWDLEQGEDSKDHEAIGGQTWTSNREGGTGKPGLLQGAPGLKLVTSED